MTMNNTQTTDSQTSELVTGVPPSVHGSGRTRALRRTRFLAVVIWAQGVAGIIMGLPLGFLLLAIGALLFVGSMPPRHRRR
jgi:hypothetical protein